MAGKTRQIEAVLREHPAVRHAGAVAVPHPVAGNTLTGFVELQDGASTPATELRAFLAGRLPHQMVPARLEIRQALPLTASGKILKRNLVEMVRRGEISPVPVRFQQREDVA